jgi:hypothetical protein
MVLLYAGVRMGKSTASPTYFIWGVRYPLSHDGDKGSDETGADGIDRGLAARGDVELGEDVGDPDWRVTLPRVSNGGVASCPCGFMIFDEEGSAEWSPRDWEARAASVTKVVKRSWSPRLRATSATRC